MNLVEDFVSIGGPFSMHARKARGTFTVNFFALFNKLQRTSIGLLIKLSLMTSLLPRRIRLLDLTEFPTVFTDVLVVLVRSSSFVLIKPHWRESIFPIVVLKVGNLCY